MPVKTLGCGGLIVVLIFAYMVLGAIGSVFTTSPQGSFAAPTSTNAASADPAPETPASNWDYTNREDEMGRGKIANATTQSTNEVNFGFPYSGSQRATLQLRRHPEYGNDVILSLENAHFLVDFRGSNVKVRFDDGEAMTFRIAESADMNRSFIFIKGFDRFYNAAKSSDQIKIEAQFYQEGPRIFVFKSTGLDFAR